MGTSWFLELNRFARKTPALHGFMSYYAERALSPLGAGLLAVAAFVLCGLVFARHKATGVAGATWAVLGGGITFGLCRLLVPLLGQPHPYQSLAHLELLVPRAAGYSLPDTRTAVAAAVAVGLVLGRRHWVGVGALLATLLLAFARVYVGAAFPADVAAGLGLGAAVGLAGWPFVSRLVVAALPKAAAQPALRVSVRAPVARFRPSRRLARERPAAKLSSNGGVMSARVIDALKAASEAAHYARVATGDAGDGPAERGN
jgi:membrane-associated phospholipid phosphatase